MTRLFRGGLLTTVAVTCVACPAWAQQKQFDVPAQSAATAIAVLGHQADIQIVAAHRYTRGKTSKAVRGSMTIDQAIATLLAGTGLTARKTGAQTYLIVEAPARIGDAGASPGDDGAGVGQADPAGTAIAENAAQAGADIVVTAQKREERLQKVPISIAVLGGKALDKQPTGGTLEALLQVPGVSESGNDAGNLYQVSIRGVSPGAVSGAGSSTVGYYIDATPFALVRAAVVPNTASYDMARIEVLRGPQGTLYGASALNGVVRIITNDADPSKFELKARGGLSTTKGGDPSFRADAAVNLPLIKDALAIRVVGGIESLGGWIEQPVLGRSNANSQLNRNLRFKVAAVPAENLHVDLSAWFERDSYDAGDYATDAGTQSTTVPQPGVTDFKVYSAKVAYTLPFMTVSSATGYLDFNQTIKSDFSYVTGGAVPVQLTSWSPTKVFTEELVLNSVGSGPWRWSGGAFYRNARGGVNFTAPGLLPGPLLSRDSSRSYAVFGQLTRTFADDRFELSGGLRYFHDTSTTAVLPGGFITPSTVAAKFNSVTPRIVATWLPSRSFTAYASYSQGFRSGLNQGPLALLSAPGLPPAKADTVKNYEIGAKGSLANGLVSFETALFYIDWINVQQIAQILYNGAYTPATVNGPSASGFGTDLSLALNPATGLKIGGSLSYSGLKLDSDVLSQGIVLYRKGDRTANSPEWTANAFASYGFPITDDLDARVNVSENYRSATSIRIAVPNGAGVASGVYKSGRPMILNANLEIANHSGKTVSIFAQNLTNWHGITTPPAVPTQEFRYRPRTIGVQFEAKF